MIKYDLICAENHAFDGWFSNAAAFDRQAADNLVICPVCGSSDVSKAIMAPAVSAETRRKGRAPLAPSPVRGPAPDDPASGGAPSLTGPSAMVPPPAGPSAPSSMTTMPTPEAMAKIVTVMREIRKTVEANAENVGRDFAEEARKIHYGETVERPIYGEASVDDAVELIDEGIVVQPLPNLPEDKN